MEAPLKEVNLSQSFHQSQRAGLKCGASAESLFAIDLFSTRASASADITAILRTGFDGGESVVSAT